MTQSGLGEPFNYLGWTSKLAPSSVLA